MGFHRLTGTLKSFKKNLNSISGNLGREGAKPQVRVDLDDFILPASPAYSSLELCVMRVWTVISRISVNSVNPT